MSQSRIFNFSQGSGLTRQALFHSSFAKEINVESNERLELLGDAVLSLTCLQFLYKKYPSKSEGELTELKCSFINGSQLSKIGDLYGLADHVCVGSNEKLNSKMVGRAVEAVIGAFFLNHGLVDTYNELLPIFEATDSGEISKVLVNYKGQLQKYAQDKYKQDPVYIVIDTNGPAHDRTYRVAAQLTNGQILGYGIGSSKKLATQLAAQKALEAIPLT